ncbi:carbon-nitrogen hydrolase family protein [Pseudoalteromonas rubra]|uniref:Carbon-nitrogen hydrolase family protein n=1 Tax=Pseudoalteromonas rubra TaxID=43658 RepID=A0A5S3X1Z9_9GAMM|nr:carbon-nitrogen hydrolase family protein [Pseudoalteromonas rubra]TMP37318.1 carbon-nitrogen hydrolase family protein [Pseudoalteromonas rubra]
MRIAVAQSSSIRGNVSLNMENHLRFIQQASRLDVDYLVFPELSLSGYEPDLAKELAFTDDDPRLKPLVEAAKKYQISVGVGAPLQSEGQPKIGLILVHHTGAVDRYEKIHLHEGEEVFFGSGQKHHMFSLGQDTVANAICADTIHPEHAEICYEAGATIYIAGVLITPEGYGKDSKKWATYASEYGMVVAIANYSQPSGGLASSGKSAIWYKDNLLAQAGESGDALVLVDNRSGVWLGEVHEI